MKQRFTVPLQELRDAIIHPAVRAPGALAVAGTAAIVAAGVMPGVALALGTDFGSGQSATTIANNFITSIAGGANAVRALCYLSALVVGAISIFKFKEHADNPQHHPVKVPFMYLGVAVGLAAMPEVLGVGIVSTFGTGAKTVSPTGAVM